jgi:hydroxymethylpyrimidine/phosphomethylpyrimidine kinase
MLRLQLEAVFEELPPAAVKTGMLFSAENISVVAGFFQNSKLKIKNLKLIVDPVMVSTSGANLLQPSAVNILKEKLLPLATLVTPNLDETEILTGRRPVSVEEMREAARQIHSRFGCAALVKGGHLECGDMSPLSKRGHVRALQKPGEAVDIFFDGKNELLLSAQFVKGIRTHGTGCTYSAAICAALALGHNLPQAVELGKQFVTAAIAGSYHVGRHFALGIYGSNRTR